MKPPEIKAKNSTNKPDLKNESSQIEQDKKEIEIKLSEQAQDLISCNYLWSISVFVWNLRLEKEIADIQQEINETEAEIEKEERKRAREG